MDREEGEMSDDQSMVVDEEVLEDKEMKDDFTLLYRADKQGLVVESLGKADAGKLEERAQRFGIDFGGSKLITQKQIEDLYKNLGIDDGFERHVRFDTLHLRGVNGVSTREIFEYLGEYRPISLEWINTYSCNIVCQDHISAALAILVHSREIKDENLKKIAEETAPYFWREGRPHPKTDFILIRFATRSDKKDTVLDSHNNVHGPQGFSFRKYTNLENIDNVSSKNPWGDLCKSWGVYDHQEVYGVGLPKMEERVVLKPRSKRTILQAEDEDILIAKKPISSRLGKRLLQSESPGNSSDSDIEWTQKNKAPRMRMHADDEQLKEKKKKKTMRTVVHESEDDEKESRAHLVSSRMHIGSERPSVRSRLGLSRNSDLQQKERGFSTSKDHSRTGIRARLGMKDKQYEETISDDDSDDGIESGHVLSRVEKVTAKRNNKLASSVWARLDNSTKKNVDPSSDLRNTIRTSRSRESKSKNPKSSDDLRSRLGVKNERFKSPLRIEIDNDYYESSD